MASHAKRSKGAPPQPKRSPEKKTKNSFFALSFDLETTEKHQSKKKGKVSLSKKIVKAKPSKPTLSPKSRATRKNQPGEPIFSLAKFIPDNSSLGKKQEKKPSATNKLQGHFKYIAYVRCDPDIQNGTPQPPKKKTVKKIHKDPQLAIRSWLYGEKSSSDAKVSKSCESSTNSAEPLRDFARQFVASK